MHASAKRGTGTKNSLVFMAFSAVLARVTVSYAHLAPTTGVAYLRAAVAPLTGYLARERIAKTSIIRKIFGGKVSAENL